MRNRLFYKLTNDLYILSTHNYRKHIHSLLSQTWFKKACKEKKVKVTYLTKNIYTKSSKTPYLYYKNQQLFLYKPMSLYFTCEALPDNNHLKLLNINIKNETVFKVASLLLKIQKTFLETTNYDDIHIVERKEFISEYIQTYNSYLDSSILSKILNHITLLSNRQINTLNYLLPNKNYVCSFYIHKIINEYRPQGKIKGDTHIAAYLEEKYNIKISRRNVCYIRKKYLISTSYKKQDRSVFYCLDKQYGYKRKLTKENIKSVEKNIEGIYELSLNTLEHYPYAKNKILYIGSSNNIKKRLSTYTTQKGHTPNMKKFLQDNAHQIYFRYLKIKDCKSYEMLLLNSFINIHGELPKLNKQRIINISQAV